MEVNIHEAKTHLSRLLQRVAAGEEVTIARSGVPVARLVAVEPEKKKIRPLGMDRGRIWIADDFDAPLPDDLLRQTESKTSISQPPAVGKSQSRQNWGSSIYPSPPPAMFLRGSPHKAFILSP